MDEHPEARFIVETLSNAGFIAYYAGGWVRDFLLRHPSDDIDIATNAPPETIQALFPHTVPLGIAFGIILVIVNDRHYEVATFRQDIDYQDGRRPSKIAFSTAEEDAKRRDFTINGMFYDPIQAKILDYVGGQEDLKKGVIRAIGNAHERIREDRLRMIRACRLSCRFGFPIEPETEKAIQAHAKELFPAVAIERVYQEFVKGHDFGKLTPMLKELSRLGLLSSIFPELKDLTQDEIIKRLDPTEKYPKNAPVAAFFLSLFPEKTESEALEMCTRFKLSRQDLLFTSFCFETKKRIQIGGEPIDWAHFYAHPSASLCLKIEAAHLTEQQRIPFLEEHEKRKEGLKKAIQRIVSKNPVLKAEDLLKAGVLPGKHLGELLRLAEKIAVNEGIEDPESLLKRLKGLSF